MYKKISLILVEYPDGRLAVQPCFEGEELYKNCQKISKDIVGSRMTLITVDYEDVLKVESKAKILNKGF